MPPKSLTEALREAEARRRTREAVAAIAAAVHTTVEVWGSPQGYTIELGRAVHVTVDPFTVTRAADPFAVVVAACRSAWHRYTPDVPPNVILGAE